MSRANKKDQRLPTGAIVYWSRMFKRGRNYRVPVWCPDCEEERIIQADDTARDNFTGLCKKCLDLRRRAAARREYPTADERLANGNVVHWSELFIGADGILSVPVTCGDCQRQRVVQAQEPCKATFTGWCNKHKGLDTGRAPGMKRKTTNGYVEVKLPRGHPFYSMADKSGWVREHRLVLAQSLGRPLTRHETVHHKNGRKDDNRSENLELWCRGHPSGQRVADLADDLRDRTIAKLVQEMLEGRDW